MREHKWVKNTEGTYTRPKQATDGGGTARLYILKRGYGGSKKSQQAETLKTAKKFLGTKKTTPGQPSTALNAKIKRMKKEVI